MDYTTVEEPVYASADKSSVSCLVHFDGMTAPVPFIAHSNDPEDHGRQLFTELMALQYGQIGPYVAPEKTPAEKYSDAIGLGLSIVSGSTPDLNGVYGVAESNTHDIVSEATFISIYKEFTNGQQTFAWADATGAARLFPSTAVFMQFAKAAAIYVSGCKQCYAALLAGNAAEFPSNIALIG